MDAILEVTLRRKVRAKFGGRIKAMVSGGAPLNPEVGQFFHSLGLTILQGYGQTEAAPVISCNRPRAGIRMESVGAAAAQHRSANRRGWRDHGARRECHARLLAQSGRNRAGAQGRLAGDRRCRPFRRGRPDRHHRPQEGFDRQRQGRQCVAAADRRDADAAAGNRAGDDRRRPQAAPRRIARPRPGDRRQSPTSSSGCRPRWTGSTARFR